MAIGTVWASRRSDAVAIGEADSRHGKRQWRLGVRVLALLEEEGKRLLHLEAIDEKRSNAKENGKKYQDGMALLYNRFVKGKTFSAGQLMLKAADHIRRYLANPSKFAANWEGPFIIKEAFDSSYYKIEAQDGSLILELINAKWLKPYYC
ncbi:hypothetical protein CCACVL1_04431 [Corchorus capsularis]|uniref:Uncharacterized protein n=1 Tax=Corchorus capsularis TaxID=210143 RepID=A0A1R3JSH6_COCAP|nr:hypothetical protein CCACVL1_04431 [Corchorus capsularis]